MARECDAESGDLPFQRRFRVLFRVLKVSFPFPMTPRLGATAGIGCVLRVLDWLSNLVIAAYALGITRCCIVPGPSSIGCVIPYAAPCGA